MLTWTTFLEAKQMSQQPKVIAFTKVSLPYGWMGNMSPYPISYKNKLWPTAEALFQALRYSDESIRDLIHQQKSPFAAKLTSKSNIGKRVVQAQSPQDLANMELILKLKLEQHPELKAELKKTGTATIIEDCTNRANESGLFWGAANQGGKWVGQNMLGKLWMKLRRGA